MNENKHTRRLFAENFCLIHMAQMHKHSHRQRRKVLMLGKSHDYGDDDEDKRKKQMFALEMGIFPCLGKQTKECCISCF